MLQLETPIEKLPLIGPVYAKRLKRLEIKTVEDLIHHYPFRYENYSLISKIGVLQPEEKVTIQGEVQSIKNEYTKRSKKIQKAHISDETGIIEVIWFNQPFLVKNIHSGDLINLSGKVTFFGKKIVLQSPEYEIVKSVSGKTKGETIHTGRIVPIYPETYRLTSKWLRHKINLVLKSVDNQLEEFLPDKIREKNNLLDFKTAVFQIHFPQNQLLAKKARKRLAFDELFLIQLISLKKKREWKEKITGKRLEILDYQKKIREFTKNLPFVLTLAQRRCIGEILTDLGTPHSMNRLLQGDVGSGKTVVATAAMYVCFLNGYQSILMAPTEILAFQHYQTIKETLSPYGLKIAVHTRSKKRINIPFKKQGQKEDKGEIKKKMTPSLPVKRQDFQQFGSVSFHDRFMVEASTYSQSLKTGNQDWDIIVGTHALLNEKLKFENVGLVVVDEQHRFGVVQRSLIRQKAKNPHFLTMTATPIPRTIALTLYRELDLSFIDEMPKGRKPVRTWVVPREKRNGAYQWIKKNVKKGDQAFIICPLIEESDTLQAVKAATKEFKKLKQKIFSDLKLGLIHGRLKTKEKEAVLESFRKGLLNILVATPVVEVGIDIPNATIMMIEAADRFGLAQLHQLRGRVGRSEKRSFCLLFSESKYARTFQRLKNLEKINIGAELAELDLKLRGPGEIYGTKQHGVPNLKIASFSDASLIKMASAASQKLITENPSLEKYPNLFEKIKKTTCFSVSPD